MMQSLPLQSFHALRAMAVTASMLASYAAFSVAERIERTDRFWQQRLWLTAASAVLGLGMWSMHFFGALEDANPSQTVYQLRLVALCLAVAISFSWAALRLVVWRPESRLRLAGGGTLIGLGVCTMHFLGEQAQRTMVIVQVREDRMILAVIVGSLLSMTSLWVVFGERYDPANMEWLRVGGSALMGSAVTAMHLLTFHALVFAPLPSYIRARGNMRGNEVGEAALLVTFGLVLLVTLGTAAIDKRRYKELSQLHAALAASQQALVRSERELREANTQLSERSIRDGLTGLHNRRRFDEALDTEWRRSLRTQKPLALLMIDVDCFKALNDSCGHQRGDECLREIARVLEDQPRRGHDVVARFGGEEFAVLLPGSDVTGAQYIAETIRHGVEALRLEHPRSLAGEWVTVSIGVCSRIPQTGETSEEMVFQADMAMYAAKRQGRNRVLLPEQVEVEVEATS